MGAGVTTHYDLDIGRKRHGTEHVPYLSSILYLPTNALPDPPQQDGQVASVRERVCVCVVCVCVCVCVFVCVCVWCVCGVCGWVGAWVRGWVRGCVGVCVCIYM
jgi:hypothetical protein